MESDAVDVVTAIPLLVGIVGTASDPAAETPELATAMTSYVASLAARYPSTPLVALCAADAAAPERVANDALRSANAAVRTIHGTDARRSIADAADILIAVSFGPSPFGPSEPVAARRSVSRRPANGPLLTPPTIRACVTIAGASVTCHYPPPDIAQGLALRDRFNADLARTPLPVPSSGTPIDRLRSRIASATRTLQTRTNWSQNTLYALALIAAGAQVGWPPWLPGGLYLKYMPAVTALILYVIVRRCAFQRRYQDYRAISEGLRVQAVWTNAGIGEGVAEGYLPTQLADLDWIRSVFRAVHAVDTTPPAPDGVASIRAWVNSQRAFFANHGKREDRRRATFERAAAIFGVTSIVMSVVTLAAQAVPAHERFALGAAAGLSALGVALARSYLRTRGYAGNANRYERMFLLFDRAAQLLDADPADAERARTVALELGRLALSEQAEWLLGQRERPITLVATSAG